MKLLIRNVFPFANNRKIMPNNKMQSVSEKILNNLMFLSFAINIFIFSSPSSSSTYTSLITYTIIYYFKTL